MNVTDLDSGTDYRRIPRALSNVYFHPLNDENKREVDKLFNTLTSGDEIVENRLLDIWGRTLKVRESSKNTRIARFQFDDLCGQPLSAADYIEITKEFTTVFLLDVPKMGMDSKDRVSLIANMIHLILTFGHQARRFITFIDACYESKTKLFVTSEVAITQVFSDDRGDSSGKPPSDHLRSVMDDLVREKLS